uniref:LysR family transcriptional regulator n=1 Tax=Thaumasiovibrio occultus TaxID=1891184 RepID=UPI00131C462B|nr:LysR family transcriptional regulator [Thaumasiovibrio occultus]
MDSIFGSVDDLYLFCEVVKAGSLQGAATRLGQPVSTLSRRLTQLEKRLQVRLLERRGRELMPTDTGQRLYEQVAYPLYQANDAVVEVLEAEHQVRGHLRFVCPATMYHSKLRFVIEQFMQDYPEVTLDIQLNLTDVSPETERDVIISFNRGERSDIIARPLFTAHYQVMVSRRFWGDRAMPNSLSELAEQPWITLPHKEMFRVDGQRYQVSARMVVNDVEMLKSAVKAGLGIAAIPVHHLSADDTDLIPLFPDLTLEPRQAWLMYRQRLYQPKALALLIARLTQDGMWQETVCGE